MSKTTVLLADDHEMIRTTLGYFIEQDPSYHVVASVGSGSDALSQTLALHPDMALLDIDMPGTSIFDVAREIRRKEAKIKIAFLSAHTDEFYITQVLDLKASYLLKAGSVDILRILPRILCGAQYIDPQIHLQTQAMERKPVASPLSILTPRERECLKLLAEGNAVKEIAVLMGLSQKTAEAHKFNLMRKLGYHNKIELVNFSIREHLVRCPCHEEHLTN
jgi:DNA-binding NarL/FixJ family response regulator